MDFLSRDLKSCSLIRHCFWVQQENRRKRRPWVFLSPISRLNNLHRLTRGGQCYKCQQCTCSQCFKNEKLTQQKNKTQRQVVEFFFVFKRKKDKNIPRLKCVCFNVSKDGDVSVSNCIVNEKLWKRMSSKTMVLLFV